jgi:hypothetical protein
VWFRDEEVGLRPALLGDPMGAEAFILGAGFSRAISPSMPLVNDLVEPLNEFLGESRSVGAATFPRLKNVELFLSSLAVSQPFLDESSNLNNRALFIEANRWLGEHMFNAQQHALGSPLPAWLAGLVRTWHARRSTRRRVVRAPRPSAKAKAGRARVRGAGGRSTAPVDVPNASVRPRREASGARRTHVPRPAPHSRRPAHRSRSSHRDDQAAARSLVDSSDQRCLRLTIAKRRRGRNDRP